MQIFFHKKFDKRFVKLPKKIQEKFFVTLETFSQNMYDKRLNNHELKGKHRYHRSINITGDIRAIYQGADNPIHGVIFLDIGSHSELYS